MKKLLIAIFVGVMTLGVFAENLKLAIPFEETDDSIKGWSVTYGKNNEKPVSVENGILSFYRDTKLQSEQTYPAKSGDVIEFSITAKGSGEMRLGCLGYSGKGFSISAFSSVIKMKGNILAEYKGKFTLPARKDNTRKMDNFKALLLAGWAADIQIKDVKINVVEK